MTKEEKRYAIAAGALVGVLVLYQYAVAPFYTEYQDNKEKIAKVKDDTIKADTLFGTERQKQKIWTRMLSEGMKTKLEDSQSQAREAVLQWAGGAGVNVSESQMEGMPKQEGKFLITTFKFTAIGNTRSIARWMLAIEKGTVPPVSPSQVAGRIPLRIDDLTITPRKPGTDDLQAIVAISTLCLLPDATDGVKTNNAAAPIGPVALGINP